MKLTRKTLAALLLVSVLLSGCGGTRERYTVCIGHSDTKTNLLHVSLEHFAEAVRERTGGRVEIVLFAGEQLGTNAEMLRMVEMGKLDAMMLSAGQQAALCPKFKVLGCRSSSPTTATFTRYSTAKSAKNCSTDWRRTTWYSWPTGKTAFDR